MGRGETLLRALGRSAFVPILLEDTIALEELMDGLLEEPDVVHVAVYGGEGKILSQRPRNIDLSLPEDIDPSRDVTRTRLPGSGKADVWDLVSPLRYQAEGPAAPRGEVSGFARIGVSERRFNRQIAAVKRYQFGVCMALTLAAFLVGGLLIRRMTRQMRDFIERLQAAAELERTNKELEAFSYSVSHDLRAPLRAIDGFSHALLEDYSGRLDDEGKDYLNRVRAGCQRMGRLIDDLLDLSRVIRHELRFEAVDLSAVARSVASQLTQAEPDRKVDLAVGDDLRAHGDPGLLRIALENLLGNAWKFTGKTASPRIEFGAAAKDGGRVFFVRDNGAGFDMAYADKLFGAFQRLHDAGEFPGTGIGLATVHRIVHRHGGRIWAEAAVGRGATFYFTLPAA